MTHTTQINYVGGSTNPPASSVAITFSAESNITETLAIGTNTLVAYTLDVSQAKSLYIYSSTDATLKTNSSGSPAATLNLIGGNAISWNNQTGIANPFGSTDITALYITNAAETVLDIRCGFDPTV
jgi:hypothetical protein